MSRFMYIDQKAFRFLRGRGSPSSFALRMGRHSPQPARRSSTQYPQFAVSFVQLSHSRNTFFHDTNVQLSQFAFDKLFWCFFCKEKGITKMFSTIIHAPVKRYIVQVIARKVLKALTMARQNGSSNRRAQRATPQARLANLVTLCYL